MTGQLEADGVLIRPVRADDVDACGRICYFAFAAIADRHGFPHDFPSVAAATDVCGFMIKHPRIYGVVAEQDGKIVGSNFLDERSKISAVGPISVDSGVQNRRVGRQLMQAVLKRVDSQRAPGVRLLQAAYHNRSLSLYAKLGFDIRETCAVLQGDALGGEAHGYAIRPATEADIGACNTLCTDIHGHDRAGELADSVTHQAATVVERQGRITGYSTGIGFRSHAVAETNDDLGALIGAAPSIDGPGLILPMRNTDMLRWCLVRGLRVVLTANIMTRGLYQDPRGPYLPSMMY